ncbi:hypothetical protein L0657_02950 [Dyadobacter sp. CY345]|uniref:hypothetical protein n=1 Tax=Dyadobacter sp. CY345 TaxID=2909335 RepID=UPI001F269700|nr:hypothetical protein [Dyadobacter sp. CY345]MCF2442901.1 hypothetical protein [Dyadobacter sp. CY345]
MKNIFYLAFLLAIGLSQSVQAQYTGKRFLTGTAGINFNNTNPANVQATAGYGYNFSFQKGKFHSETKASGWSLSSSMTGENRVYEIYRGTAYNRYEKKGIDNIEISVGRFWQYYKHFTDKFGIYAGPNVSLSYGQSHKYEFLGQDLQDRHTNTIRAAFGLGAGIYYSFSERWWIQGSLAFSRPIYAEYSFGNARSLEFGTRSESTTLSYSVTPSFNFPNVGLGLRYFLK